MIATETQTQTTDPLLSRREASTYLNVPYATISGWVSRNRKAGRIQRLPFIMLGGRAMYAKSTLDRVRRCGVLTDSQLAEESRACGSTVKFTN